ncbi:hypothetical protein CspeluHIS016_0309940 [Cutaneotrichosporon spelunceum]|uniref:RNA-directed DNA polymerase n=1 Tax=Cutaneotrichosporon spelunceum TaxID=1672016 RepID=A0AAD3TVA3_9TREE|nr:hypothetical protein CspeluHIS016_0309940 [Cutaneotrichosporon spelunceum]
MRHRRSPSTSYSQTPSDSEDKPPRGYRLLTQDIPTFGGGDANVDEWLEDVTTLIEQSNAKYYEVTQRMPVILKGPAKKWLRTLSREKLRELRTWDDWCAILRKAFRKHGYQRQLVVRARERRLNIGEDISLYFYDKMALLRQAYPNAPDHTVAYDILEGLPEDFVELADVDASMALYDLHERLVRYLDVNGRYHRFPPRPCAKCGGKHWDEDHPETGMKATSPATGTNNTKIGERRAGQNAYVIEIGDAEVNVIENPQVITPAHTKNDAVNGPQNKDLRFTPAYTSVRIGGTAVRAILDSGAGVSIIGDDDASHLLPKALRKPCSAFTVRGIGASTVFSYVTGEVTFPSSMPITVAIDFFISPAAPRGLLIGSDVLGPLGASLDFGKGSATIRGTHTFPISFAAPASRRPFSDDNARAVRTRNAFVVMPNHRALLPLMVDGLTDSETVSPFVVEPIAIHGNPMPVYAGRVLADQKEFLGEVTNLRDRPILLRAGDVVGRALAVDPTTDILHTTNMKEDRSSFIQEVDINPSLTDEQRAAVVKLLHDHHRAFSVNGHVGRTSMTNFSVDTGTAQPVGQAPYHASPRQRQAIDESIDKMLSAEQIRASSSPWSSPVIVVNQNGKPRVCIDYRKLNTVTKGDQYPLPRMDDILSSFEGKMWFTTLDANRGYHQVPVDDNSIDKLAFRTHRGLFAPLVMPFGAKNAPATFQRMMDALLAVGKWRWALAYLDDVIVFSTTFEEHIEHVAWTLSKFIEAGLTIGPAKSHLFQQSLDALGHTVSALGIGIIGRNIEAIVNQLPPTTLAALDRWHGLTGFYRTRIRNHAIINRPIAEKITQSRKSGEYTPLDGAALAAFKELQALVAKEPVMGHPNFDLHHWRVETDACRDGFGAVLSQPGTNGKYRPLAYISRITSKAEANYSATELECTAIVWALNRFRPYLDGDDIELITDHAALQWILDYKGDNGRLIRQALALQHYRPHLTIKHRPGKLHAHVDQLSRAPLGSEHTPFRRAAAEVEAHVAWRCRADEEELLLIRKGLQEDPHFGPIFKDCLLNRTSDSHDSTSAHRRSPYVVHDDLLYLYRPAQNTLVLCVPAAAQELRETILHDHHDSVVSGHHGTDKTYLSIARYYFWPKMRRMVEAYVRSCDSCQKSKPLNVAPTGILQPMPIPPARWDTITMDFAVKLPMSNGFDSILVIVDKLTKRTHLSATNETATAVDIAKILIRDVVRLHGLPAHIVSDRDARFTSDLWRAVTKTLGIKLLMSTSFHPQTDGQSERQIRTLKEALRHFVNTRQNNWSELLPLLEIAFNNSVQASTGRTPFELDLGFHPRLLHYGFASSTAVTTADAAAFLEHLDSSITDAIESLQAAQATQAKGFNARHRLVEYKRNDQVLLSNRVFNPQSRKTAPSKKLAPTFYGPFRVVEVCGPTVLLLDLPPTIKIHPRVNTRNVRKYHPRAPHKEALRTVDKVFGYREKIKTNACPDGKPEWLVSFTGDPTGSEHWLDRNELSFYGGDAILDAHDSPESQE